MTRAFTFVLAVLLTTLALAEPRFRADDGNLWRLADNPALAAASMDYLAFGAAAVRDGSWTAPITDISVTSPLLSFRYAWKGADSTLSMGASAGPWSGFSLGYRQDAVTTADAESTLYGFGALWRPLNLLSLGLTLDNAFATSRVWGAGLAVRPLSLMWPQSDAFTLTADARWDGAFSWERWGARLAWNGSDLRVWWDPNTRTPGFEATVALGPGEATGSLDRVGSALRFSNLTSDLSPWSGVVLRIRGTAPLASAPVPAPVFGPPTPNLPDLLALLDRATTDSRVVAVVFEDPATVPGLAGAEDLRLAVKRLRDAGKKVYTHAVSYDDSVGFQGWVSAADRISLDPTGALNLVAGGSRRLYLKELLDKVGVKFVNFAPWETKSYYNDLTEASMPDAERAMLKRFLGSRDQRAADDLAAGRAGKMEGAAAELVAAGPYLQPNIAQDKGLIDAVENRWAFEKYVGGLYPGATWVDTLPALANRSWGPPAVGRTVALVDLAGDIVFGDGQAGQSIGQLAIDQLAALRDDPTVSAVVLRINSPGGAVTPSDALADEVKRTVESGKPVVAVFGDVAASGGYYLAAPASHVIARPGTTTGSIGVTAAFFSAAGLLDQLKIHPDGVDLAPSAAFGDWTRGLSPADAEKWEASILALYDRFLDVVATGRHIDKAKLEPLARGQVYTGLEALDLGLVDELGGLDEASAWLEKRLGGPLQWRWLLPGTTDPWGGLLASALGAIPATTASGRLLAAIDRLAAPELEALTAAAARGQGLQVWYPGP